MLDPFTLATGIVGICGLAIQVAQITTEYIDGVASAPTEICQLDLQLHALSDTLKMLEDLLRSDSIDDTLFDPASGLGLVLRSCQKQLESLLKKLSRRDGTASSKISSSLGRMKWPFEKKEVVETTRRLHECCQVFHFCLTMDNWYAYKCLWRTYC
jgi:hypothetical protein